MRLDQARDLIAGTNTAHWNLIHGGPTFRVEHHVWINADEPDTNLDVNVHTAALRSDLDLTIAWGMEIDYLPHGLGGRREPMTFDWAENFTDPNVHGVYADVFWRAALIDRVQMMSVDGGRAYLPMPQDKIAARNALEVPIGWTPTITRWAHAFGRLIDDFAHQARHYEEYIHRTGVTIDHD